MKLKSYILKLVISIFCIMLFIPRVFAADQRVKAVLPSFKVSINGNEVDNLYRQYPFLVYKDITYFPMTWYDCRLLGLETQWSQEQGLAIDQAKVAASYYPYQKSSKNSAGVSVIVPSYKITVNGRAIDNAKEEYPLLSYNNVTYFPLTWSFAHEEFGWDYSWDAAKGLSISSRNPQLLQTGLPEYASENSVVVFEDYYYYVQTMDNTNYIYRAPINATAAEELVCLYELDSINSYSRLVNFQIRDNALWFSYHRGGATMGADVYYRINEDGKGVMVFSGYLDFRRTPLGTLRIGQYVPPSGNNLMLIPTEQTDVAFRPVGDPRLIYGWWLNMGDSGSSFGWDHSTTVIGEDVYVLASVYPDDSKAKDINKIYKVNLNTDHTEKVINQEVRGFKIIQDKIYYVKEQDDLLYAAALDGTGEKQLSHKPLSRVSPEYLEINGNVFYTGVTADNKLLLYKAEPSGEDKLVLEEPILHMEPIGDKVLCRLEAGADYEIMIFDDKGKLELAIAEQVSGLFCYGDMLVIRSEESHSVRLLAQ